MIILLLKDNTIKNMMILDKEIQIVIDNLDIKRSQQVVIYQKNQINMIQVVRYKQLK